MCDWFNYYDYNARSGSRNRQRNCNSLVYRKCDWTIRPVLLKTRAIDAQDFVHFTHGCWCRHVWTTTFPIRPTVAHWPQNRGSAVPYSSQYIFYLFFHSDSPLKLRLHQTNPNLDSLKGLLKWKSLKFSWCEHCCLGYIHTEQTQNGSKFSCFVFDGVPFTLSNKNVTLKYSIRFRSVWIEPCVRLMSDSFIFCSVWSHSRIARNSRMADEHIFNRCQVVERLGLFYAFTLKFKLT